MRQPEPPPRRVPTPAPAARGEPVRPARRARRKSAAIFAAIAVAAALGGASAIWYDSNTSSAGKTEKPQATATSAREATTARSPNQGVAGQRHAPTTSREVSGRSAPRSPLRPPFRPPAFRVPSAPKEPLDEITLPARAHRLAAWLPSRRPTAANLRHWLYQHAWIVTGARFGWWHGAEALRILIRVDRRVESRWGIGYRSEAVARRALAEVVARAH
jgi:hypothetical protein